MDFLICCAYVFLIFVRPQDWVPILAKIHMLDGVAGLGIIVVFWHLTRGRKPNPLESPQFVCVLLFWAVAVMSYVSQFFLAEVTETFNQMGKLTLAFALPMVTINSRKRMDKMFFLLLGCIALLGMHCLMQKMTGHGLGGLGPSVRGGRWDPIISVRAFGIFGGPNEMGTLAAVGVILCLSMIARMWPAVLTCVCLTGMGALFAAVLWWTQSRQAILILVAGVYALFAKHSVRRQVIAVGVAAVVLVAGVALHGRWRGVSLADDDSVARRAACITGGLRVFKQHPALGVGKDRAAEAIGMRMALHNSFLQVLVENGFFGLVFVVAIVGCTILQLTFLLRAIPEGPVDRVNLSHARLLFALVLVVTVGAYFQNRPYHADSFIYLGMASAYGLNMLGVHPEAVPAHFRARWLAGRGAAFALGAAVGLIVLIHLTSKLYWQLG